MKNRLLFLLLLSAILITSCSTFKIDIDGQQEKVKNWKSLVVLEVLISPPDAPLFPLIDAGIYKGNFNDIYGEINVLHEKNADSVVKHLGHLFEQYSKSKILYGESLFAIFSPENLKKYDIKTYSLILDNENFPKIPLPKYAKNFFDFSGESSPTDYFGNKNLNLIKPRLKKICELLNVDGLLIVTFSVPTISVGMFGINGDRLLNGELLFFDNDGNNICSGEIRSEKSTGKAGDLTNYEFLFFEYYRLTNLFLRKLYLGEEPIK